MRFEDMADDVYEYLMSSKLDNLAIMGHSLGKIY